MQLADTIEKMTGERQRRCRSEISIGGLEPDRALNRGARRNFASILRRNGAISLRGLLRIACRA
jgi:hypothetical protein